MRTGIYYVSIPNWGKHNPRSDREGFSWFKLDNQFHLHMRVRRGYSAIATNLLPLLFQECSRANANEEAFSFRVDLGVSMLGYSAKQIIDAIQELADGHDGFGGEIVLVDSSRTFNAVQKSPSADTTDTTDTRQQTQRPKAPVFDFLSLYKKYPRQDGKTRGLAICKVQIKTPEDYTALSQAIDNYAAKVKREATATKFIKLFSTFMGCWRDALEYSATSDAGPQGFDWNQIKVDKDAV